MSQILDIINVIADAVIASEAIADWCQAKYTKDPTVVIGTNSIAPAGKTDAPALVLASVEEGSFKNDQRVVYKLLMFALIYNENVTESTGKKIYDGFSDCEEFAELIAKVLVKLPQKSTIEFASLSAESFPLFAEKMVMVIELPDPQRGSPAMRR